RQSIPAPPPSTRSRGRADGCPRRRAPPARGRARRASLLQPRGRLDAKLLQRFAHAAALLRRIELRFSRVVGPEQHVAVILLRDAQEVAELRLVAFAQLQDGELYALAFALVR